MVSLFGLLLVASACSRSVTVDEVSGPALVDQDAATIAVHTGEGDRSFRVAGALVARAGDPFPTEEGGPGCLRPGSTSQRLRVGFIQVPADHGAPGRDVAVWILCE